jgi:hypothetical protein
MSFPFSNLFAVKDTFAFLPGYRPCVQWRDKVLMYQFLVLMAKAGFVSAKRVLSLKIKRVFAAIRPDA